jgi:hypothetical protein
VHLPAGALVIPWLIGSRTARQALAISGTRPPFPTREIALKWEWEIQVATLGLTPLEPTANPYADLSISARQASAPLIGIRSD